jgi:predicted glycosyltransferase
MGVTASSARRGATTALLYCHDTFGLGHLRRTLSLVEALHERRPDVSLLIATGSPLAHAFRLPHRVDYLKLPSVEKVGAAYAARSLPLPLEEVTALRTDILAAAARRVRPDLVVVDNVPAGLGGELLPALRELRRSGRTRLVLGLRDIVDEPERVRRAWTRDGSYGLLDDVYDRILVYGQPDVFDVVAEYRFSRAAQTKTRYVGYFRRRRPAVRQRGGRPLVLVTAGGGGDGFSLLRTALESRTQACLTEASWVVVSGPFMPPHEQAELMKLARCLPDTQLVEFASDLPALIASADVVVSMGGYNSVCEILSARRRAVIVPRVEPRLEQLLRARALERRGLVRVVHPDDLTPTQLQLHIEALLATAASNREDVDLSGLVGATAELESLLDAAEPLAAGGAR